MIDENRILLAQKHMQHYGVDFELCDLINNDNPGFAQWHDIAKLDVAILAALLDHRIIASGVEFATVPCPHDYGYVAYFSYDHKSMYVNVPKCTARLIADYRIARAKHDEV